MRSTLVFVCQRGDLEAKSALLAASLRRHVTGDVELVACLPGPEATWGRPSATTLDLFAALDIRTVGISNHVDDGYPIGNKISAVGIATAAERLVFLDSDILCLRPFAVDACFRGDFTAKPADLPTGVQDAGQWRRLYRTFGLVEPRRRVLATAAEQLLWPYFNAGVLGFRTGLGFPEAWLSCARRIDADPAVPARRPHLDQIALPLALAQLGIEFEPLPERLNFPAHLQPLSADPPILCHYHGWEVLQREPVLRSFASELVRDYPPLGELLATTPLRSMSPGSRWPFASQAPAGREPRARETSRAHPPLHALDGLITGFPRSGTSFLCSCLSRVPNQVVVNEPVEIFGALSHQPPWGVPLLHAELRRRIIAGEPIDNKVHAGRMIEDTADRDLREPHLPRIENDAFGLWTKNTLAYAARIRLLRSVMPGTPIVACLRHPYEVVASWIDTFPHLREAAVEQFPVGSPADPLLDPEDRERLQVIAGCSDLPLRRALLWRHLACIFLRHRDQVTFIRYEDLSSDPGRAIATVFAGIPGFPATPTTDTLPAARPRRPRPPLGTDDLRAIRDICGETAAALGYDL